MRGGVIHAGTWDCSCGLDGLAIVAGVEPVGPPKRPNVSRADIALAYQRFERAFLDHRPEGQGLVEANLVFEAVTKVFLG